MAGRFLSRLLRQAAAGASPIVPEIDADHCTHAIVTDASCRLCGQACPRDAIGFSDQALTLDAGRCDGCGLCVPACPQRAIACPGGNAFSAAPVMYAACERTADREGDAVLPCLHALGADDLIRAWLGGVREVRIARMACDDCSRGGRARLDGAAKAVSAVLESRGLEAISVIELGVRDWQAALAAAKRRQDVSPSRRRFLKRGLREAAGLMLTAEAKPADDPMRQAISLLPEPALAVFLHVPEFDELSCVACDACARICPTGALKIVDDAAEQAYVVHSSLCSGCAMCMDVCEPKAVRVGSLQAAPRRTLRLSPRSCRACGALFRVPVAGTGGDICGVCRKTRRHRLLYQVMDDA